MQEPSRGGPRPRDLLIAVFAIVVNVVVAAVLVAWDSIRRVLSRIDL